MSYHWPEDQIAGRLRRPMSRPARAALLLAAASLAVLSLVARDPDLLDRAVHDPFRFVARIIAHLDDNWAAASLQDRRSAE